MTCCSPGEIARLREENATLRRKLAEREQELVMVYEGLSSLQRQILELQPAQEAVSVRRGSVTFFGSMAGPR
jgi:hypothetical protein